MTMYKNGTQVLLDNGTLAIIEGVDDHDLETNETVYFGTTEDGENLYFSDDTITEAYED
jgi:hypothetical protein